MLNYNALNDFIITICPIADEGDLRVSMMAVAKTEENSPLYHAVSGVWEDDYEYHLVHTLGLDKELAQKATEELKAGVPVHVGVSCFLDQLIGCGFQGVARV